MGRKVVARAKQGVRGWWVDVERTSVKATDAKNKVMQKHGLEGLFRLPKRTAKRIAKEINREYANLFTKARA